MQRSQFHFPYTATFLSFSPILFFPPTNQTSSQSNTYGGHTTHAVLYIVDFLNPKASKHQVGLICKYAIMAFPAWMWTSIPKKHWPLTRQFTLYPLHQQPQHVCSLHSSAILTDLILHICSQSASNVANTEVANYRKQLILPWFWTRIVTQKAAVRAFHPSIRGFTRSRRVKRLTAACWKSRQLNQ